MFFTHALVVETLVYSLPSVRAPATLFQLEKTFKAPVIEAYAMSEAAHQMTANFLPPGMRKPGSVGKGRGVEVQIMDGEGNPLTTKEIGEVCIRGLNVIKGEQKTVRVLDCVRPL